MWLSTAVQQQRSLARSMTILSCECLIHTVLIFILKAERQRINISATVSVQRLYVTTTVDQAYKPNNEHTRLHQQHNTVASLSM